ncbi:MAG: hypothetical protein CMH55_06590 [Myxococcales bacterium]|nr:hypothetical protein [Myxococcales bacterium]
MDQRGRNLARVDAGFLLVAGVGMAAYGASFPAASAAIDGLVAQGHHPQIARLLAWGQGAWLGFALGIALIFFAAFLLRRFAQLEMDDESSESAVATLSPEEHILALSAGLQTIHQDLAGLAKDAETSDYLEICERMEALKEEHVGGLVAQKDRLVAQYGLLAYAQFISSVSAAERNMNRAWSTLVDGYPGEAKLALESASGALQNCELR